MVDDAYAYLQYAFASEMFAHKRHHSKAEMDQSATYEAASYDDWSCAYNAEQSYSPYYNYSQSNEYGQSNYGWPSQGQEYDSQGWGPLPPPPPPRLSRALSYLPPACLRMERPPEMQGAATHGQDGPSSPSRFPFVAMLLQLEPSSLLRPLSPPQL